MRQWEGQTDRDMGENQAALIEQLTQEIGASASESGVTVPATDQKTQKRCMTELRNIQISATDIRFTQRAEDQMCAPQLDALVLKDGTEIKTTGGASRWTSEAGGGEWATIYFWTLPVDLEQAAGFRVGEQTIFLDAIE